MVERQIVALETGVRFSSPALFELRREKPAAKRGASQQESSKIIEIGDKIK